jgi:mannosyltransferase
MMGRVKRIVIPDRLKKIFDKPLLPILLAALIVRLPGIASRPLWYDEAFSVLFSSQGPSAMAYGTLAVESGVAADIHPLGYYTLLWLWGMVFGTSPLAMRSLSLFLGLGIIALAYVLASRLFGGKVAALSGWMLAFAPFQVHYAQEARMYTLLTLILLAVTLTYWHCLQGDKRWTWILFSVLAAAAMYVHNLAALFLACLALTPVFLRRWRALGKTLVSALIAVVLYMPWLVQLPSQLARVSWAYWIPRPELIELVRTLLVFTSGLPLPDWGLPVALFLTILIMTAAIWATLRALRTKCHSSRRAVWLAGLAFGPVLLMFLVSQLQPIYLDRAMLPAGVMFVLWLAWTADVPVLPSIARQGVLAAIGLSFVLGLASSYIYRGFPYAPFDEVNALIQEQLSTNEVVLHSNKITAIPAVYEDPTIDHRYLSDPPGSGSDTLALATQEVLGLLADEDAEQAVGDAGGVWFIIFPREIEEYLSQGAEGHPALSWLQSEFELEEVSGFGDLAVYHFRR